MSEDLHTDEQPSAISTWDRLRNKALMVGAELFSPRGRRAMGIAALAGFAANTIMRGAGIDLMGGHGSPSIHEHAAALPDIASDALPTDSLEMPDIQPVAHQDQLGADVVPLPDVKSGQGWEGYVKDFNEANKPHGTTAGMHLNPDFITSDSDEAVELRHALEETGDGFVGRHGGFGMNKPGALSPEGQEELRAWMAPVKTPVEYVEAPAPLDIGEPASMPKPEEDGGMASSEIGEAPRGVSLSEGLTTAALSLMGYGALRFRNWRKRSAAGGRHRAQRNGGSSFVTELVSSGRAEGRAIGRHRAAKGGRHRG